MLEYVSNEKPHLLTLDMTCEVNLIEKNAKKTQVNFEVKKRGLTSDQQKELECGINHIIDHFVVPIIEESGL